MVKSKKYFLIGAIIFLIILIVMAVAISDKTVAPWEKDEKQEINK